MRYALWPSNFCGDLSKSTQLRSRLTALLTESVLTPDPNADKDKDQVLDPIRWFGSNSLAGSLASLETKYVQRKIWRRILGSGNRAFYVPESDSESTEPSSDSDGDYDFIQHDSGCMFDARGLRLFINPLHKLRGTSLHLVLDFLGNFQLKTRKR